MGNTLKAWVSTRDICEGLPRHENAAALLHIGRILVRRRFAEAAEQE